MDGPSICPLTYRRKGGAGPRPGGFSLLEMMMVVTLILIIASIATPVYRSVVVRAREGGRVSGRVSGTLFREEAFV